MTRVRFLLRKRYPHPDGPRRDVGAVLPIDSSLARVWAERGVVEIMDDPTTAARNAQETQDGQALADTPVTSLRAALETVSDPQVVREAARVDDRKTAGPIYQERLDELE